MEQDLFYIQEKKYVLNSFWLKVIGCVLMTLDHIALLFIDNSGFGSTINAYYILRAIGKISFPIFAYLAFESINRTTHPKKYLLTLLIFSLGLDIFGYIFSAIKHITIASNPFIGNVFTDLLLGVLTVYLLKMKNRFSILAILPIAYAILSNFKINDTYGTLFKTDWGTFSIMFFIFMFITREFYHYSLKKKALEMNVEVESLYSDSVVTTNNILASIALILTELISYLLYLSNNKTTFIPNEFVPIGTYSSLAIIFINLYNGKRGYNSKIAKYFFYGYYPIHLIVLGVISLFFGVLKNF